MTEFTVTNVEQNDDGTVNITGQSEDGQICTLYNAYPTKYSGRGETIHYSQIWIDVPINYKEKK